MIAKNLSIEELSKRAADGLREVFGREATSMAVAPGRVNLMGEHVDYCDGLVMPLAIERYVVMAACLNGGANCRVTGPGLEVAEIPLGVEQEISELKWTNYLRGVIQGFRELNFSIPGFDLFIDSSLPLGAGLSSSAALECAFATLLESLIDTVLGTKEKALLAQRAEHEFAGVRCGIMDQFASAFGVEDQLILIDCRTEKPERVPFLDQNLAILVANTGVSHDLADGGYEARRAATEEGLAILGKESWREVTMEELNDKRNELGEVRFRRGRHVVTEIARTQEAAEGFRAGDYSRMGRLMEGSHQSLRDDFEVSCDELDLMVGLARELGFEGGVLGTRMTGGGFGGSTVTLCRTSEVEAIAAHLFSGYRAATGIAPVIFATRPAAGARMIPVKG